ncbi:hypothetical protein EJ06DRAFT_554225 [Trichodelitschia bisporula]|uniref:Uncharacterized protein n=1 Tax=Trichodelitschia bisporula TaxID=703511 RepID=A0A6G1I7R2_9PEZI|nr:hypothetical protein EJ06DRAFT_554225 [Trichodelitschia bisporula]
MTLKEDNINTVETAMTTTQGPATTVASINEVAKSFSATMGAVCHNLSGYKPVNKAYVKEALKPTIKLAISSLKPRPTPVFLRMYTEDDEKKSGKILADNHYYTDNIVQSGDVINSKHVGGVANKAAPSVDNKKAVMIQDYAAVEMMRAAAKTEYGLIDRKIFAERAKKKRDQAKGKVVKRCDPERWHMRRNPKYKRDTTVAATEAAQSTASTEPTTEAAEANEKFASDLMQLN